MGGFVKYPDLEWSTKLQELRKTLRTLSMPTHLWKKTVVYSRLIKIGKISEAEGSKEAPRIRKIVESEDVEEVKCLKCGKIGDPSVIKLSLRGESRLLFQK